MPTQKWGRGVRMEELGFKGIELRQRSLWAGQEGTGRNGGANRPE